MASPWEDAPLATEQSTNPPRPWETAPGANDEVAETGNPLWEQVKQAAQAADDMARIISNAATFGYADKFAADMSGATGMGGPTTPEGQGALTDQARKNAGSAGVAGDVLGSVAQGAMLPGAAFAGPVRAAMTGTGLATAETIGKSYFRTGDMPAPEEVIPGAILGAVGGAAGYGLGKLVNRPRLAPAEQKSVDILNKAGVDVIDAQAMTGRGARSALKRAGAANGAEDVMQNQKVAFSRAALEKAGIAAPNGTLDDGVLKTAFETVGDQMNKLALANNMTGGAARPIFGQILTDMQPIVNTYAQSTGSQAPIIRTTFKRMAEYARKGTMTGEQYQRMTSELEGAARANPGVAEFARKMRASIDRGMENYIAQTNPSDSTYWQIARRQFKNLLVVQDAIGRTGNREIAGGLVTPQALQAATKKINGSRLFATKSDDFSELANAGVHILKPLPVATSATPTEMAAIMTRRLVGAATGASQGFLHSGGNPYAATAAGMAGLVVPDAMNAMRGMTALRSVNSPFRAVGAAEAGGRIGGGIGATMGQASSDNPFLKATLGYE